MSSHHNDARHWEWCAVVPGCVCVDGIAVISHVKQFFQVTFLCIEGGENALIVPGLWTGGPVLNPVVNDYPRALLLVKIFSLFLYFSFWLSRVFLVHAGLL